MWSWPFVILVTHHVVPVTMSSALGDAQFFAVVASLQLQRAIAATTRHKLHLVLQMIMVHADTLLY
jgi:hypothetical protein